MNLGVLLPPDHFGFMSRPACCYTGGRKDPWGKTNFSIINLSALDVFTASCQVSFQSSSWGLTFPSSICSTLIICLLKCSTCWDSSQGRKSSCYLLKLGFQGWEGREVNDSMVLLGLQATPMELHWKLELPFTDNTSLQWWHFNTLYFSEDKAMSKSRDLPLNLLSHNLVVKKDK